MIKEISSCENRKFQDCISLNPTIMECALCNQSTVDEAGVCPDCLLGLPNVSSIKKEEDDWDLELPSMEWEDKLQLQTTTPCQLPFMEWEEELQVHLQTTTPCHQDLELSASEEEDTIFYSDPESDVCSEQEEESPKTRLTNEEIYTYIYNEGNTIADKLITLGIYPGISFHLAGQGKFIISK